MSIFCANSASESHHRNHYHSTGSTSASSTSWRNRPQWFQSSLHSQHGIHGPHGQHHTGSRHSNHAGIHGPQGQHHGQHSTHGKRHSSSPTCQVKALANTMEKKRVSLEKSICRNTVPLKDLLEMMLKLLKVHEVKMVMQLLSELISLPLSKDTFSTSKDDLASVLIALHAQVRSDAERGAADGLTLFERYYSIWTAGSCSPPLSRPGSQHIPLRQISPNSQNSAASVHRPASAQRQAAQSPTPSSKSSPGHPSAPVAPQMDLPSQVKPPSHEPCRLDALELGEEDRQLHEMELNCVYGTSAEPERGRVNELHSLGVSAPYMSEDARSGDLQGIHSLPHTNMGSSEPMPREASITYRSMEGESQQTAVTTTAEESWADEVHQESEAEDDNDNIFKQMNSSCNSVATDAQPATNETVTQRELGNGASYRGSFLKRRATMTNALLTQMTTRLSAKALDLKDMMRDANMQMKVNLKTTKTMDVLDETWLGLPSNALIIHPNGSLRMTWDVLALIAIVNEAVLVPLGVFFEMETPEVIMLLSTVFFFIDLVLNLFTGYFHDGMLIMKWKPILWNYIKGWFLLDLISTFPWYAVFNSGGGTMLKLAKFGKMARVLRLLRIAKLNMLVTRIEEFLAGAVIAISLSLMKIVAFLGLLCHWCACIWGWLGDPARCRGCSAHRVEFCEPGGPCEAGIQGTPWRSRYAVYDFTLVDQYLLSLRFAVGLITGSETDIQPGFWAERTFVCFMTFCSFILCSTVISQIIVTFHKILQEQSEQLELMRNFKEFMSAGRVPFPLQAKVRRYLEFQFKSRKDLQMRRFDLLERLSPWLRAELLVHMNKPVLTQHPFFKQLPHTILAHICCLAESMTCAPGDILAEPGQNLGKMYFLVRGKLHIRFPEAWIVPEKLKNTDEDPDNPGFLLHPPGFVCASNLMKNEVHSYCITSAAHSEVVMISRNDLEQLTGEFPSLQGFIDKSEKAVEENRFQDSSLKDLQSVIRARSIRPGSGSKIFAERTSTSSTASTDCVEPGAFTKVALP